MDLSDDELNQERPQNIRPYQFEPRRSQITFDDERNPDIPEESESGSEFDDHDEDNIPNGDRLDNLAWCDCQQCGLMRSQTELVCCHEIDPVNNKIEEEGVTCITEHEGFIGNCLNQHVVETAMYQFVEVDGLIEDNEPIHELYRYIAYRQFTRWIWHILGKGRRKVIPSCAVMKIRATYPSEEYTGFKYARP